MLEHLQWETLESRRKKIQLTLLYKITNNHVDIPADAYLTRCTGRTRAAHSNKYLHLAAKTDCYKYSFLPRTVPSWNTLPAVVAEAPSLEQFKRELSCVKF
jgi:hypothetical protein